MEAVANIVEAIMKTTGLKKNINQQKFVVE